MAHLAPSTSPPPPFAPTDLCRIAEEAAQRLQSRVGQATGIQDKGADGSVPDLATDQDRECQRWLVTKLGELQPDADILAEEGDVRPTGTTYWVIDPIDGTNNFVSGLPIWAVNIAYVEKGRLLAAVTAAPALGPPILAVAGGGTTRGGERLRVGNRPLSMATLALGIQPRNFYRLDPAWLQHIVSRVRCVRILGSIAVELAWCAAGKIDLWIGGGHPWDYLPGALLIREAGGVFSENGIAQGLHIAGNRELVREIGDWLTTRIHSLQAGG